MSVSGLIEAQAAEKWIGIRMADSPRKPGDPGELSKIGTVRSSGRRRLLQAGISAAPIIMTVASRPVLAEVNCQSPSGMLSGNVSGSTGAPCSGRLPSYWKVQTLYPGTYVPTNLFKDTVTPDLGYNPNLTLAGVLALGTVGASAPSDVAQFIIAALLNRADGTVPESILPQATIKDMWTQYGNGLTPGYQVATGVYWTGSQIIQYLISTMG